MRRAALLILLVCPATFSEDGQKNQKARSKPKLKLTPPSIASSKCEEVSCPATEEPICAKIKYKQDANKTLFIRMLNKCEMEYSKCHTDVEVTKVPLKYCDDHGTFKKIKKYLKTSVSPKQRRRVKRNARFSDPVPQVQFREDDEHEKEEDNEVDAKVTKLNYNEVRRKSAKEYQKNKAKSVRREKTKSVHPKATNQKKPVKGVLRAGRNRRAKSSNEVVAKDSYTLRPRYTIKRGNTKRHPPQQHAFSAPMFDGSMFSGGISVLNTKLAHQKPRRPLLQGKMFDRPMFGNTGSEEIQRPATHGVRPFTGRAHRPGSAFFTGKMFDSPLLGDAGDDVPAPAPLGQNFPDADQPRIVATPPDSNSEGKRPGHFDEPMFEEPMFGVTPPDSNSKGKRPGHFDKPMFEEPMFGVTPPDSNSEEQTSPENVDLEMPGKRPGHFDKPMFEEPMFGEKDRKPDDQDPEQPHIAGDSNDQVDQRDQGGQTDQGGQSDQGGQGNQGDLDGPNYQGDHTDQSGQANQGDHTVQGGQSNQDVPSEEEIHHDRGGNQQMSYERHMAEWNREENLPRQENEQRVIVIVNGTEERCPKACEARARMVCARCGHRVYRTFMSLCHMRAFACQHDDERVELAARVPCLMLAPYLMNDVETVDVWPQTQDDNIDVVGIFDHCRNKAKKRDANGNLVPIDPDDPICGIRIEPRT